MSWGNFSLASGAGNTIGFNCFLMEANPSVLLYKNGFQGRHHTAIEVASFSNGKLRMIVSPVEARLMVALMTEGRDFQIIVL